MSVNLTYFVHSTTPDNEKEISSGWNDTPLSPLGITQSHQLKEVLQGRVFDVVITSDLIRAVQTTEIAFENHPFVIRDPRLRECNYGDLNGHSSSIVEPMQEDVSICFPNGESSEDVRLRVLSLVEEVRRDYPGKSVAFVSSKIPQLSLDVLVNGFSWEEAFARDWRKTKSWQPGWKYVL